MLSFGFNNKTRQSRMSLLKMSVLCKNIKHTMKSDNCSWISKRYLHHTVMGYNKNLIS